jgi:hypothetical protein
MPLQQGGAQAEMTAVSDASWERISSVSASTRRAPPELTGMPRDAFQAMIERIAVSYHAIIEQRRHHQRGGDRPALPSYRGDLT